jgi:hypothetical protein
VIDATALEYLLGRAGDPDRFERWTAQARATGWCARPIRLAGSTLTVDCVTGEIRARYDTGGEPDGTLLKTCGQRRATACASCAATYRADAFQLVAAGLRGGKGVPETIAAHPAVFLTLTAPSFGAVHSRRERNGIARPCHPAASGTCAHGMASACATIHAAADPTLGSPLCGDCFDYPGTILWNASATELWRRTTIAIRRHLARLAGTTTRELAQVVRLSYAKVIEYQARGTVHVHAVVRLDDPGGNPPPLAASALMTAVSTAAQVVAAPWPIAGDSRSATWGQQHDIRPIDAATGPGVAGYIAKYATKSTDALGHLDHRLTARDLDRLDLPKHLARLVRTAWHLGGDKELAPLRLRAWAHTLGFRGHWLTKSRHYSTTLTQLRGARAAHQAGPAIENADQVKDWRYVARGWAHPGDAAIAHTAAAERDEARRLARENRQNQPPKEDTP